MRAVVTGAAHGIGRAVAERLHRDGAQVGWIDLDPLVVEAAAGRSGCVAAVADVGHVPAALAAFDDVVGRLGGLDVLVCCAGVGGPTTPVADTTVEDFEAVLRVNLVGTFALAGAAARVMDPHGVIVTIGSMLGRRPEENGAPYCVSKAGVEMLTKVLALELAGRSIRVNCVAPGNIMTRMHRTHLEEIAQERAVTLETVVDEVRAGVPLGRHGQPDDIAATVSWLVSGESSYVTGQTMLVDGGVLLR